MKWDWEEKPEYVAGRNEMRRMAEWFVSRNPKEAGGVLASSLIGLMYSLEMGEDPKDVLQGIKDALRSGGYEYGGVGNKGMPGGG